MNLSLSPQRPDWHLLLEDCVTRHWMAHGQAISHGLEEEFWVLTPDEDKTIEELLSIQRALTRFERRLEEIEHPVFMTSRVQTSSMRAMGLCMVSLMVLSFSGMSAPRSARPHSQKTRRCYDIPIVRSGDTTRGFASAVIASATPSATPSSPPEIDVNHVWSERDTCLRRGQNLLSHACCVKAVNRPDSSIDPSHWRPDPAYHGTGNYRCNETFRRENGDGTFDVSRCNWCDYQAVVIRIIGRIAHPGQHMIHTRRSQHARRSRSHTPR